jgi:hypothetical protein
MALSGSKKNATGSCSHCGCGQRVDSIGPEFLVQLKNCFLEILQSSIFQENNGSHSLLVERATTKSFTGSQQNTDVTDGRSAVSFQSSSTPEQPTVIRMDEAVSIEESADERDVLSSNETSEPSAATWKTVKNKAKNIHSDQQFQLSHGLSDDRNVVTTKKKQQGKGGSRGREQVQRSSSRNKHVTK